MGITSDDQTACDGRNTQSVKPADARPVGVPAGLHGPAVLFVDSFLRTTIVRWRDLHLRPRHAQPYAVLLAVQLANGFPQSIVIACGRRVGLRGLHPKRYQKHYSLPNSPLRKPCWTAIVTLITVPIPSFNRNI